MPRNSHLRSFQALNTVLSPRSRRYHRRSPIQIRSRGAVLLPSSFRLTPVGNPSRHHARTRTRVVTRTRVTTRVNTRTPRNQRSRRQSQVRARNPTPTPRNQRSRRQGQIRARNPTPTPRNRRSRSHRRIRARNPTPTPRQYTPTPTPARTPTPTPRANEELRNFLTPFYRSSGHQPSSSRIFKVETTCTNTQDPISLDDFTDEMVKNSYPNDLITIILPNQSKGECYLRSDLSKTWNAYINEDLIFRWRNKNPSSIIKSEPLFKTPLSNSWITANTAAAIILNKDQKIFPLNELRGKYFIGSQNHFISSIFGQESTIFKLNYRY